MRDDTTDDRSRHRCSLQVLDNEVIFLRSVVDKVSGPNEVAWSRDIYVNVSRAVVGVRVILRG